MKVLALALLPLLAGSRAAAVTPAVLSATPALESGAPESATVNVRPSSFGTGIVVTTGWFFQDTMFYSGGRGGITAGAGKAFPVLRWLAVWAGAGAFRSHGTMHTQANGADFETTFDGDAVWAELGVVTPWLPFPVALTAYRHRTGLDETGRSGAAAGRRYTGTADGWGAGAAVHLLFEFFLGKSDRPPRGLGVAVEYVGLMDFSARTVATADPAGLTADHRNWKPFKGEALRIGLEYEF